MRTSPSVRHRIRVIRQLRAARESLQSWDNSIRAAAVQGPAVASDQPSPAAVLLAIVAEAQRSLTDRLIELGAEKGGAKSDVHRPSPSVVIAANRSTESTLRLCVNACRACGRSLGAAFREAQTVADAASARILYGSIRAFEKQLWVLDPLQVY